MARILDFIPLIHPVQIGTGNQELMATLLFSMLVHVEKDETTLEPDLATTWTASSDAKTYTFHLNPKAVWSDGQPVTSKDVLYTISWAAQNPDAYKEDSVQAWLEVAGADAVKGTTNTPSGLQAPDDHTVVVTLAAPDAIWLRNIAVAPYVILPQHILGTLTAAQADSCDFCKGTPGVTIGSGPYDLATPITATGADFTAKANWWKGPVNIQRIHYEIQDSSVSVAQLAAGELDFVIRVPPDAGPSLATVPHLKQLNEPGVGIRPGLQQHVHRGQAHPPGGGLRDRPPADHPTGARRQSDAEPDHSAGLQGLLRHQHVPVRPRQGQAAAPAGRLGSKPDVQPLQPLRRPELHDRRAGDPAAAGADRHEGQPGRGA
jgi:ABC-type transport system substrate-binding protein